MWYKHARDEKRATMLINGFYRLEYQEQFKKISLDSLSKRRTRWNYNSDKDN